MKKLELIEELGKEIDFKKIQAKASEILENYASSDLTPLEILACNEFLKSVLEESFDVQVNKIVKAGLPPIEFEA